MPLLCVYPLPLPLSHSLVTFLSHVCGCRFVYLWVISSCRPTMDGIDPDVLLEWLQTGFGDERDLQVC